MSSPREYFDKDSSQNLRVHAVHTGENPQTGERFEIIAAVSLDFAAGAKSAFLYIPDTAITSLLVEHYLQHINEVLKVADGVPVPGGFPHSDGQVSSANLIFSGRLFTYTPYRFTDEEKARLSATAAAEIALTLRDGAYCEARSKVEAPLAFICHDSRDRDPFVRELAATLQKMLCPVAYDEYSLRGGLNLQASIEQGLRECRKCILVLSPSFLANYGWEEGEFDAAFSREILELQDVIIPIWHGVSREDVYAYSPRLLNRPAIPSSVGTDEVARRVLTVINGSD